MDEPADREGLLLTAHQPLADRMYSVLLEQFMSGERQPGEPLNIGALTRELSVSQTPLREALARLEHTGLVTREALKGYRVAPMLSRAEVAQLMDARSVIEPALASDAASNATVAFLTELQSTVDDLSRSARHADEDPADFRVSWAAEVRFHALIAQQSANRFLLIAYDALDPQIQRFRLFSKRGNTGAGIAAREHRAVCEALERGDRRLAENRMRDHLAAAKVRNLAFYDASARDAADAKETT